MNKKIELLQQLITKHFQEEIKLKKEIIENERNIDQLKLDMTQNVENIKKKKSEKKELESLNVKLDEKYTKQYEFINKRDEIHKQINQLNKEQGGHYLLLQYQYYNVLLDNMNLEHKKQSNVNLIKIKDLQVKKLFVQIKLRDDFINDANFELKKKNVKLKADNNIKTIDDLEVEPISLVLPQIVITNTSNSITHKPTNKNFDNQKNNKLAYPNINVNLQREITPLSKKLN